MMRILMMMPMGWKMINTPFLGTTFLMSMKPGAIIAALVILF